MSSVAEHRWETQTFERTVLAIVRTKTSAIRLLDVLPLFGGDFRISVRFVFDDSSAFSGDVPEFLQAAGIHFTPLADISALRGDLALMASENIELADIDAPIIVLPHGTGFHRYVPDSAGPGYRLAGLPPAERMAGKDVWLAVPHPAQRDQLARDFPSAAARCVVVGDLVFDQLAASLERREAYRRALGVRPGQRLVVATSTWEDGSLYKSWPGLPARLLGELPADEYLVALVLHPNIWASLGPYLLRLRLSDALGAGLVLLPPTGGWQAALVAADAVIGDHGSVALYAAALDRPVLLTGDQGAARVVPGTPPTELAGLAGRLDAHRPLAQQVAASIDAHVPGRLGALADRMFANQGRAARSLRDLIYTTLDLPAPGTEPPVDLAAAPAPAHSAPRSFLVYTRLGRDDEVRLWRFPAAVRNEWVPDPSALPHLCVDEEDPDPRRLGNASVIVRREIAAPGDVTPWLADTLRRYPDCRLAAAPVPGGCLASLPDGRHVQVTAITDPAIAGPAVYARSRANGQLPGTLKIRLGTRSLDARVTPVVLG